MADTPERRPAPPATSWIPFIILVSLALGNFLSKPALESERPLDGFPEKTNLARTQTYPETLNGDPLQVLLDATLDKGGTELRVSTEAIPVKPFSDAVGSRGDVLVLPVVVNAGSNAV